MPRWNIAVSVDSRGVVVGAQKAGAATQAMAGQMAGAQGAVRGLQASLGGLGLALGAGALVKGMVTIAARFEDLRTQLETVEGSAVAARRTFDIIKEFSARTPFQIQNLTESWINLRAKGFEPSLRTMRALGDMAAAFGRDITQATQAVTQAAFGEAEMLKQFGIIMRTEGESVRITFKGVTQEVERDADAIVAALTGIAETNFAGGMERQAETLSGKLSTLKDVAANLADSIMEATGAFESLKDVLGGLVAITGSPGFEKLLRAGAELTPLAQLRRILEPLAEMFGGGGLSGKIEAALTGGGGGSLEPLNQNLQRIGEHLSEIEVLEKKITLHKRIEALSKALPAAEARMRALIRTHRERMEAIRQEYEDTLRLKELLEETLAIVDRNVGKAVVDIPEVAGDFVDEFNRKVMADTPPVFQAIARDFARHLGANLQHIGANLIRDLFEGRSIDMSQLLGDVGFALGSTVNPFVGAIAESFGRVLGGLFGGGGFTERFVGAVNVFAAAAGELAEAARSVRQSVLRLETLLGTKIFGDTKLSVTQTGPEEFRANFGNIVEAFGSTAEEAARAAMDAFASSIVSQIAQGKIDLSGVAPQIVAALSESVFSSFDEMVEAIETWQGSLNASIDVLGAWTPATDAAMQRLDAWRLAIERSGLSAEAAAPFLVELARAADLLTMRAKGGFFGAVADAMERMGFSSVEVAKFRAKADQISFKLTVAKLEIERRALGLVGAFWDNLFKQFNAFASDWRNFLAASASITAPVIRSAPRIARGLGSLGNALGDQLRQARESLTEYLNALGFTSPGSPTPGKAGLEAALAEARRAARAGDVDLFKSSSNAALQIAQRLFGSTAGFDAVLEQIRQIGQFDPKVQGAGGTVGAVRRVESVNRQGFASLGASFGEVSQDVAQMKPTILDPPDEMIPPKIVEFRPLFQDLEVKIDERMRQMAESTQFNTDAIAQLTRVLGGPIRTVPAT